MTAPPSLLLSRLFPPHPSGHPATFDAAGPLSVGQIRDRSAALTHALQQHPAQRIGLWTPDASRFLIALLAVAQSGKTLILPPNGQPGTLTSLAGHWDLLLDEEVISLADGPTPDTSGRTAPALSLYDSPVIFFTSGTTAAPKQIPRRLSQLLHEVDAVTTLLDPVVPAGAPVFATVPHHHAYGLVFRLLWPWVSGRPFARFGHDVWETLLPHLPDGAVLISSPAHLSRLGGLNRAAIPALILSAGAPLPPSAAAAATALFGTAPREIFGSTETGAIACRLTGGTALPPWQPLPGTRVDRSDDGRLVVQAPWVDGAYLCDDLIDLCPDGFHLRGRIGRIVKVDGKRVSLPAVETSLTALPLVADAAVTLVPQRRPPLQPEGNSLPSPDLAPVDLAAAVVLTPAGQTLYRDLGAFRLGRHLRTLLADHLDPPARPRRWRFVPTLPASVLGKRQDAAITALFEACPMSDSPRLPLIHAVQTGDNRVDIDMTLPSDLLWFQGHFRDFPILPGVVQLDWALRFSRDHLDLPSPVARLFQVKYKAGLFPGDRVTLTLTLKHPPAGPARLVFEYRRDGDLCSAGQITVPQ